jgi:LPXTG-motif cell wall-anchored protein
MRIRVTAALLANARGQWPADFVTLAESTTPVPRQVRPDLPPVLLHELRFPVADPAQVYFFLEAIAFNPANYTGPVDLFITPFYEVTGQGISPFLLVGVGAALASLGGFLLWRGQKRERSAKTKGKGSKGRGKKVTPRGAEHDGRRTRTSQGSRRRT